MLLSTALTATDLARNAMLLPASCLVEGFYGIIGFAKIEGDKAPAHLLERLAESRKKHPQLIAMRRTGWRYDDGGVRS